MIRTPTIRFLAFATVLVVLSACGILEAGGDDEFTMHVAPETVECVGFVPQQCLLVKYKPDEEWTYFYDSIAGFEYQPGFLYELRVSRRRIANPPADGSSYEYLLIQVVNKRAATAVGS